MEQDTNPEHDKLIETLKFTPRTYKIRLWGYGGEYVMGTVKREVYDYFKQRRLSVSDFAWDWDYSEQNNIPEDMQPFTGGSWNECDDMGHAWGVDNGAGTLQIEDETGETHYERELSDLDGCDVNLSWADEVWIDSQPAGTVVFIGTSSEKGTFFEGDLELTQPFDPEKLLLEITEIDGNDIITSVQYDGEYIDNYGGDTSGKSSDFGFYIAGSQKDGKWERYKDMDDIEYTLTDWFPKTVKPVREGQYDVKDKDGYSYRATWTGQRWEQTWGEPPKEIKIKEWRGIAYDPDEQSLRDELTSICQEFDLTKEI